MTPPGACAFVPGPAEPRVLVWTRGREGPRAGPSEPSDTTRRRWHEAHLPTQPHSASAKARVSIAKQQPGRAQGPGTATRQGPASAGGRHLQEVAFGSTVSASLAWGSRSGSGPGVSAYEPAWSGALEGSIPGQPVGRVPRGLPVRRRLALKIESPGSVQPDGPDSADSPDRLRDSLRRPDFLRVTGQGRRISSRFFVIFVLAREQDAERGPGDPRGRPRLGITVTRKVGNAVRRNRIKRLVREWFRTAKRRLGPYDVVVIAKRDFPSRVRLGRVGQDLDRAVTPASAPDGARQGSAAGAVRVAVDGAHPGCGGAGPDSGSGACADRVRSEPR